jgi:hypothetical protein
MLKITKVRGYLICSGSCFKAPTCLNRICMISGNETTFELNIRHIAPFRNKSNNVLELPLHRSENCVLVNVPPPHRLTRIKRYILFRNKRYPKDMNGAEIKRSELTRRHEQRIKTELSHSSFSMNSFFRNSSILLHRIPQHRQLLFRKLTIFNTHCFGFALAGFT